MTRRGRQRGIALLALVAVLVIGGTWYLVSRLQELSANRTAIERVKNAKVLNRAKQALIGYVIAQANHAGENNPGALPCPEAGGYFNSTTGNDGKVSSSCTLPAVGRFPWRTIGTEKLVDAAGEPLWYVVSPGWAYTGSNTVINSNSAGQLTIDGVTPASLATADTVIALIIAPGLPFSVPAAAGCVAFSQARSQTSGVAPDVRNYLECDNSNGDSNFVTTGPSGSFNDQVLKVTVGDLMPGLEASIANRIEREIAPQLKAIYNSNTWATNVSATNPVYPYPAGTTAPSTGLVANPGTTASFQGSSASCSASVCAGLLPVIFTNNPGASTLCTPGGSSLCDPTFVKWASGTIEVKSLTISGINYVPGTYGGITWTATVTNCTVSTVGSPQYSELDCNANIPALAGVLTTNVIYEVRGVASNVGMALRQFNSAASLTGITVTSTPSVSMANTGSATVTFQGSTSAPTTATVVANALCGLVGAGIQCRQVTISVPLPPLFPDHALLNSNDPTTGWFMRNEWFRSLYYVVAPGYTPSVLPAQPSCTTGTNCVSLSESVTAASNTSPIQVTSQSHGLTSGMHVTISGVTGNTAANGTWPVSVVDKDNFTLTGSTGNGAYASGGNVTVPARALLILAGASLNGNTRPTTALSDYLEFGNVNATGQSTLPFQKQTVTNRIPYAYTDTGGANAYSISLSSVPTGVPIFFKVKAGGTNTAASTLNTTATGVKNILNSDGSALASPWGQIQAGAIVQVIYDGTQFLLAKRPFNDRVIVIDSN